MNPFTALTSKIFGAVAIAALLFGIVQTVRLGNAQDDLETARNALAGEVARHAVTRQSVKTLKQAIRTKNAESKARAERYEAAAEKARQDAKEADRRFRSTQATNDRLRANVGKGGNQCETPEDVTDALSGL